MTYQRTTDVQIARADYFCTYVITANALEVKKKDRRPNHGLPIIEVAVLREEQERTNKRTSSLSVGQGAGGVRGEGWDEKM